MIRELIFLSLFFLLYECIPEGVVVTVTTTLEPTTTAPEVFPVPGKGEKLEAEIDQIGKDMQPESNVVVVQEEFKINDDFDLKQKLENFTVAKLKTTEKVQEVIDGGDAAEQEDPVPEPEDTEQLRASENEFGEFAEPMKDRKNHDEEAPGNPEKPEFIQEDGAVEKPETTQPDPAEKPEEAIVGAVGPHEKPVTPTEIQETQVGTSEKHTQNLPIPPKTKQFKNPEAPKKDDFISSDGILVKHDPDDEIVEKEPRKNEEKVEKSEKEKSDDDWISWDLVHFLLLLSPYEEDEVTWWTIIFEAVKCSLRNCPNHSTFWHHSPVYLPRITRHRRQTSELEDLPTNPPRTKPCPCRDLENYFEKLYESIQASKKINETAKN